MSLTLPRLVVGEAGGPAPRILEAPAESLLSPAEARALASSTVVAVAEGAEVDHATPLAGGRWAVGRHKGDTCVWRILAPDDVERVGGHAAWLWTSDAWFDPSRPAGARMRAPAALPLRHLLRLAAPTGGRSRRTVKALAALVAALRANVPAALVVEAEVLESTAHPARWLALALICVLPPARRETLRITIGAPEPHPDKIDLALLSTEPNGFAVVRASDPPDEGDDLVAYYVRNRLYDDDPEALEAAAYMFDGGGDRWGDGIAALIREGIPGVSEVTPELLVEDPERAVRAFAARLRAGAQLDQPLVDQLVALTLATRDPRPWRALWRRPAVQRSEAVQSLLVEAHKLRPSPALVVELCSLYPRGAPLELWVPTLLDWLEQGNAPDAVTEAIQITLLEWPLAATGATRASVWAEAVRSLVRLGRDEQAMSALVRSPLAAEVARDGAGRALVAAWATIPAAFRDPAAMEQLVELLHGAPDGDRAVAELYRHVRGQADEAHALVGAWVRRVSAAPVADDPVLQAVREAEALDLWVRACFDGGDPAAAGDALQRWAPEPDDGMWLAASTALDVLCVDPRDRFVAMRAFDFALESLVGHALARAEKAVASAGFPDPEIAALAERLASLPEADSVWAWIAVVAATPGTWQDDTIDATVVAFCGSPPGEEGGRIAIMASERLGSAPGWEPLDLARWLVRLSLAPASDLNPALAGALLRGIGHRADGPAFLAAMVTELLALPPDHPAIRWLVELLVPHGWFGERLARALRSVPADRIPPELLGSWSTLLDASGRG